MNFFPGIRLRYGSYILKKKTAGIVRERSIVNLNHALNIGLIFDYNSEETSRAIQHFITTLKNKKKKVYALGYLSQKKQCVNNSTVGDFRMITMKDLNWFGKPLNNITESFIPLTFDILMDMSLKDHYPLRYLLALSKARFKVGRFGSGHPFYDLMIDIEKNPCIDYLIENVQHYLTEINKTT